MFFDMLRKSSKFFWFFFLFFLKEKIQKRTPLPTTNEFLSEDKKTSVVWLRRYYVKMEKLGFNRSFPKKSLLFLQPSQ